MTRVLPSFAPASSTPPAATSTQTQHLSPLVSTSKAVSTPPPCQSSKTFRHQIQAPQDYMHTWSKSGMYVPKKLFNPSASVAISPIPFTYRQALKDLNWSAAMRDEFDALTKQNTWSLVSKPAGVNVVSRKWICRHKHNSDGSFA
jgi:hypothetical protein